jgi:hypothetical protein
MMPPTLIRRPGPQHHVGQSASNIGVHRTAHSAPLWSANLGAVVSIKLRKIKSWWTYFILDRCPCGGDFQEWDDKRAFCWECGRRQ